MNAKYIRQSIAATNPERNGHPTMKVIEPDLFAAV